MQNGMLKEQQYNGIISEDYNLMNHKKIAQELFVKHKLEVVKASKTVAGVMMLFKVCNLVKLGGFPEGAIKIGDAFIDYWFCKKVLMNKGKIGIAKGVYLFHAYRMGELNPRKQTMHLKKKYESVN